MSFSKIENRKRSGIILGGMFAITSVAGVASQNVAANNKMLDTMFDLFTSQNLAVRFASYSTIILFIVVLSYLCYVGISKWHSSKKQELDNLEKDYSPQVEQKKESKRLSAQEENAFRNFLLNYESSNDGCVKFKFKVVSQEGGNKTVDVTCKFVTTLRQLCNCAYETSKKNQKSFKEEFTSLILAGRGIFVENFLRDLAEDEGLKLNSKNTILIAYKDGNKSSKDDWHYFGEKYGAEDFICRADSTTSSGGISE